MLIIMILLLIALFIGWATSKGINSFLEGFIPSAVITGLIVMATWAFSYSTYLDLKQYQYTIEQYRSSITYYSQTIQAPSIADRAVTDLKYNENTRVLAELIDKYRYHITNYNNILIGKRIMKGNIFYNWLIVSPDDNMKPIKFMDDINLND